MDVVELSNVIKDAVKKLDIDSKKLQLSKFEKEMANTDFWSDKESARYVSKQAVDLKNEIEIWQSLADDSQELSELSEMGEDISSQLKDLEKRFKTNKIKLYFAGPFDDHNAVLTIQSGAGGRDAQDWASMLMRMYKRWTQSKGFKTKLIQESTNEDGGVKSATLEITGANVYGLLRQEHGVHRLVRKSPFNSAGSRETSFAMVEILPAIEEPEEAEIDEGDLKIDTYRSSGKGGQSVNTTDSAVRVTHIPTGVTVAIQNERSQIQNKETALKILRSKLVRLKLEQHQEELAELKGPNKETAWGNQIRNYVLDPYQLVKDSRSGFETSDVEGVLDGKLDEIVEAGLKTDS